MVDYVLRLAKPLAAKIWVLYVVPNIDVFIGYEQGPAFIRKDLAGEMKKEHAFLQKIALEVRKSGVDAEAIVVEGEIIEGILEKAAELKADMIVCGQSDHGFLATAFGANTGFELLKRSEVPVLVFPIGPINPD